MGAKCRVPYRGSRKPVFLFVGISPGPDENEQGTSFVGSAGEKLKELLDKARLPEELCAWTNLVKCLPRDPGSRSVRYPTEEEIDACCLALEAEISQTDPSIIIPLGGAVTTYFMESSVKISKVRGMRHIVESPSLRYRYLKMRLAVSSGLLDVDPKESKFIGFSYKERVRALKNAVKVGYKDVPTRTRVIFPSFNPASIVRGFEQAEYDLLADLNYLAQKTTEEDSSGNYVKVASIEYLIELTDKLCYRYRNGEFKFLLYDIETTSLDPYDPDQFITTVGFTEGPGHAWVVPFEHHESPFKGDNMALGAVRAHLGKTFDLIPVGGHNLKFDFIFSRLRGIRLGQVYDDTLLMAKSLFNDQGDHDLETLVSKYTDLILHKTVIKEVMAVLPKEEKYNTDNYDLDLIVEYNGGDCDGNHRLLTKFEQMLIDADVYDAHRDLPARATIPVAEMEVNGCPLNWDLIETLDTEMTQEIAAGYKELDDFGLLDIHEDLYGKKLNLNSPEQTSFLVFDILCFEPRKYGNVRKNGKLKGQRIPSADKHILQELLEYANEQIQKLSNNPGAIASDEVNMWRMRYAAIKTIQEIKATSKLHSSYVKGLSKKACKDGFLRTKYGIRKEDTGRFNSVDPSLQVIPWHSTIKRMFVSRFQNGLIMSADESQMELRVFAMDSGDERLAQAFKDGKDLHRYIAAAVLGVLEEEVPSEDRRRIKTVNFGLLYGRGDASIAAQEGISKERAAQIRQDIFSQFPAVGALIKRTHAFVREHGYVRYINGFVRNLPWYNLSESQAARADRQGVNSRIQGPASDLVAQAMIYAYNRLKALKFHSKLWHYVHDSLGFDVPPGELFYLMILLGKAMNTDLAQRYSWFNGVPLKVDYEIGISWGEFVDAKIESSSERLVKFSGKEKYFKRILETFGGWGAQKPEVVSYVTEVQEEPAVIRSLMRSSGEKVQFSHVDAVVQFPPLQRLEPVYLHRGFTLWGEGESLLV